jgi:hypothetical protein
MSAQAITQVDEQGVAPVQPDASAIVQMIERAVLDPRVDIDKMERLLAMQERVMERSARTSFNAALATMQPRLPVIGERGEIKNTGGKVQSTFALWEDINDAIRPLLAEHGFALTFRTGRANGNPTVTGVLSHREGHSEETTLELPLDTSGSKNNVQGIGSSTSYGKRYTACALLNITTRGEDDGGQSAGQSPVFQRVVADVNACEGPDELRAWKATHYESAAKLLSPEDLREVVALYNRRIKAARENVGGGQ